MAQWAQPAPQEDLSGGVNELAGLDVSGTSLYAGKTAQALPGGLGLGQGLHVIVDHISHKLVGFDVHFLKGGTGGGAFAALHALQGVDSADKPDLFDGIHGVSSFSPRASARSSVK